MGGEIGRNGGVVEGKETLIKIYPMKKYLEQDRKSIRLERNLCHILVKNMVTFSCTLIIQRRLQWNGV